MRGYSVNNLKLLVNGECINLGCFVDLVKNKPINMEQYIASYKHLIGCVVSYDGSILMVVDCWNLGIHVEGIGDVHIKNPYFKALRLYLDDETLGTYKQYMQLHYPEYEHIWKHQL